MRHQPSPARQCCDLIDARSAGRSTYDAWQPIELPIHPRGWHCVIRPLATAAPELYDRGARMVAIHVEETRSAERRGWLRARWRALALVLAVAAAHAPPLQREGGDRDAALRAELARRAGLVVGDDEPVHWFVGANAGSCTLGGARAVLRARPAPALPHDVYLARAELSPEGRLLRSCSVHNLTETALADETELWSDGPRVAWQLRAQGRTYRVEYADLRGEPSPSGPEFGALARWQWRVSRWQETGQWRGLRRRSFRIDPALPSLDVTWTSSSLVLQGPDLSATIGTESGAEDLSYTQGGGATTLVEDSRAPAAPGNLLTWSVDRARALPWLGKERVQWLKAMWFGAAESVERALVRAAPEAFASEALADGADLGAAVPPVVAAATVNAHGFPPAPLTPELEPALAGEGAWRSLEGDPFVRARRGAPPMFATTFIRPDPRLETARVVVVMWDPRRLDLHFMAGTEEPASATGEVSAGMIPRDPRLLSRLVGAFNGGFQTTHGAFGAQVGGRLLVPPRPYAATVMRFTDGAAGFGTWPLNGSVPPGVESFRQNLTPLVSDGALNPYGRRWWGGVPLGWTDVTRTVRSALCMTRQGHVGYFYGSRVDHEALGRALLMAQCRYGIHLDMNAGHTGFEFYSVVPRATPPLAENELALRWKVEGGVPDVPALRFRSRRLFRNMQLMHFPRYIRRQSRDFFYLTERPLVSEPSPDSAAVQADGAAGAHPFPQAMSVSRRKPDPSRPETEILVLEIDLKSVSPGVGTAAFPPQDNVLSVALPTDLGRGRALWLEDHGAQIGAARADRHVVACELAEGDASAAWGVRDGEILVYAEVVTARNPKRDAPLLDRVLAEAGATQRFLAAPPAFVTVGSGTDLRGQSANRAQLEAPEQPALHFRRHAWQALRAPFAETEIVGPETWQPHQP